MAYGGLDCGRFHLPPSDFHHRITTDESPIIILDVRNDCEYNIDHFEGAISLETQTYAAQSWKKIDRDLKSNQIIGNKN